MIGDQIKAILGELIALGILGLIAYAIFESKVAPSIPSAAQVSQGLKDIVTNGPSALVDAIKGNNDSTYITREQQTQMAAAALAAKKAQMAQASS